MLVTVGVERAGSERCGPVGAVGNGRRLRRLRIALVTDRCDPRPSVVHAGDRLRNDQERRRRRGRVEPERAERDQPGAGQLHGIGHSSVCRQVAPDCGNRPGQRGRTRPADRYDRRAGADDALTPTQPHQRIMRIGQRQQVVDRLDLPGLDHQRWETGSAGHLTSLDFRRGCGSTRAPGARHCYPVPVAQVGRRRPLGARLRLSRPRQLGRVVRAAGGMAQHPSRPERRDRRPQRHPHAPERRVRDDGERSTVADPHLYRPRLGHRLVAERSRRRGGHRHGSRCRASPRRARDLDRSTTATRARWSSGSKRWLSTWNGGCAPRRLPSTTPRRMPGLSASPPVDWPPRVLIVERAQRVETPRTRPSRGVLDSTRDPVPSRRSPEGPGPRQRNVRRGRGRLRPDEHHPERR